MSTEKDFIEVPFRAKDSELEGFEYTIPQGYEAEIKGGKVIVRKAESEDEKIKKEILEYFYQFENGELRGVDITSWIAWLEKQGEQKSVKERQKDLDDAYRRGLKDCHEAYNTEPSETDFIRKEIYDIIAALPLSDKRTGMLLWLESQKSSTATNKQKPVE